MAMASISNSTEEFSLWLKKKLIDLNTDDEIFSPYILGILESDDSEEEKSEALEGILTEICENDINDLCSEIIKKWSTLLKKVIEDEKCVAKIDVDEKLAKLLQNTKVQSVQAAPAASKEQQALKKAILAQYAEVSDGEECSDGEGATASSSAVVTKNTNAEGVAKAEREKRDKDKEESQRKKDKDKEDRAKQKTKDEDRKDKEKKRTQKGEKRR